MNRTLKIYIVFLVLLTVTIVFIDSKTPKPIDWRPSYSLIDKIPFGLYVFDHEIQHVLKGQKINKFSTTPYEYLDSKFDYDSLVNNYRIKGTFMAIAGQLTFEQESITEIFTFVGRGNSAFISTEVFPAALLDSLKLEINTEDLPLNKLDNWLSNKKLGVKKYDFKTGANLDYFSKIDTAKTTVLGYQNSKNKRINFIKVKYQKGSFYLHTQPTAFTNFHLLKSNHHEYASKVLSYIPQGDVFWCTKDQTGEVISNSPMRYILSQAALKWAWYFFLIGMLIFMFFGAKRKQRIIPILKPLANTTVDFTKTIGNLYYQEGDHNNIIDKKIIFFLERIRTDFLIETNKLDDDFVKKLHSKSGKKIEDISHLIQWINRYKKNNFLSVEADLLELNKAIEKIIS